MKFCPVIDTNPPPQLRQLPILAIDLGFAEKAASCGLSGHAKGLQFSDAVTATARWVASQEHDVVIILEAPLSGSFDEIGNPCPRGEFETHHSRTREASSRRWQSGPGASMALAALHFLRLLGEKAEHSNAVVHLVEGFCSRYGDSKPSDTRVANELLSLWKGGVLLEQVAGATRLSILRILSPKAPNEPPAILRVPDGFC